MLELKLRNIQLFTDTMDVDGRITILKWILQITFSYEIDMDNKSSFIGNL